MNAIEISGLSKRYQDFTLDNVTLALPQGGVMGLVGENGAGKSTLIRLTMNAASRDGGTVKVLGRDNRDADFAAVKEDVGVVLDEAYFPEVLTAKNVGAVMQNTYRNWRAETYARYLDQFRLPANKPFKDFSRGMKMKLAIAVALSHEAKLLILDEATSGLDPIVRDEILDIFLDFTREETHSLLLSSHIVGDLEKICDYIAFLHRGRLLFCEEKDRLLEEYALVRLSAADFEAVPPEAVRGKRATKYGVEALVMSDLVTSAIPRERLTLEDIILFLAKGENA